MEKYNDFIDCIYNSIVKCLFPDYKHHDTKLKKTNIFKKLKTIIFKK